jgi:hypothetical protein
MSDHAHTALPWKGTDSGTGIFSAGEQLGKNKIIAICSSDAVSRSRGENIANADFILRACNSHYQLLDTLDFVRGWFVDNELDSEYYAIFEEIRAALAKVRRQK